MGNTLDYSVDPDKINENTVRSDAAYYANPKNGAPPEVRQLAQALLGLLKRRNRKAAARKRAIRSLQRAHNETKRLLEQARRRIEVLEATERIVDRRWPLPEDSRQFGETPR